MHLFVRVSGIQEPPRYRHITGRPLSLRFRDRPQQSLEVRPRAQHRAQQRAQQYFLNPTHTMYYSREDISNCTYHTISVLMPTPCFIERV